MHELSLASGILDIVQEYVPRDRRSAVRGVRVRVGSLSGVVPESLEFSFAAIVAGTPLQHASLVIEHVPASVRCNRCRCEFGVELPIFVCPQCNSSETTMLQGNELQVVEIELQDQPAEAQ
ncbi:MAG TPA: hydrogenase maturation nickel metallochaperone HypA [Bacteroidota bacterium]|nr:hydrogenase maturation nickel metallochaperone HypA [Bacteroidota bacterium]